MLQTPRCDIGQPASEGGHGLERRRDPHATQAAARTPATLGRSPQAAHTVSERCSDTVRVSLHRGPEQDTALRQGRPLVHLGPGAPRKAELGTPNEAPIRHQQEIHWVFGTNKQRAKSHAFVCR